MRATVSLLSKGLLSTSNTHLLRRPSVCSSFDVFDSLTWARRTFYSGLDESRVKRLRRSGMTFNRPRGRDFLSLNFEKRIRLVPFHTVGDLYAPPRLQNSSTDAKPSGSRVLVVELISLDDVEAMVPFPAVHPSFYTKGGSPSPFVTIDDVDVVDCGVSTTRQFLLPANKRQLRQNGDTSLLRGAYTEDGGVCFNVALCIEPYLDVDRYRREEAQVEMISAYRNILYEAAELPSGTVDVLRIPTLSCDSCGERFRHEIGKLNQQSLIKGFHRLSHEAKEALILNPRFTVELYVPQLLLPQFEKAFLEDAWETPWSTMCPGRTALYPGLAPPRTLMPLEGWVGKRPELIEAIETKGRSLMIGTPRALDGTAVEDREVLSEIRMFGRKEEEQARLEGERRTAAAEGLETPDSASAPLRPGIHQF